MTALPAMIEGRRNVVTQLYLDHHKEEWYQKALAYLTQRRSFVQRRFVECTRYVEVHPNNSAAFSFEFASILRDCGSIFSSVLDGVLKGTGTKTKSETNMKNYRDFLCSQDQIHLYSVHYRNQFPNGLILPLYSLKHQKSPNWWVSYNNVKHSEAVNAHDGNLGNATTALAALVILEVILEKPSSDTLWVNVGLHDTEGSADMNKMLRLFPQSE